MVTVLSPDSPQPEIRAEWVRRLREENIPQGRGQLANGDERCCLGVLCDMAVEAGVIKAYDPGDAWLSEVTAGWAGLAGVSGEYQDGDEEEHELSVVNDDGASFPAIAGIIESEDSLFTWSQG